MDILTRFGMSVTESDVEGITAVLKELTPAFEKVVEKPDGVPILDFLRSIETKEEGVSALKLETFPSGTTLFMTGNLSKDGDVESIVVNIINRNGSWFLEIFINCNTTTTGYLKRIRPIITKVMGLASILI